MINPAVPARTMTSVNSYTTQWDTIERRQRSIFLAAFSRLDNNVTQATIEESILSIVIDASELVSKVDLKNYEYSYAAKQRLSGGLVWNGGQPRDLPTLTVNDALAMRPKGTH